MNERSDINRAIETWMGEGPSTMPDRVIDVVADRISHRPQRPAWRLVWRRPVNTQLKLLAAAAAVIVIAVAGWKLLPDSSGPGGSSSPSPLASATPSPSPSPSSTPRPTRMEVQGKSVWWTAQVPVGWNSSGGWFLTTGQGTAGPTGISVTATGAVNVPIDPCDAVGKVSDGQSVADVVASLEARDDLVVSNPSATTLGGYSGTRVDVEAPTDLSACDGLYLLFAEPDGSGLPIQGSSNLLRIWIIDVEGRPMIFLIESFPGTPAGDLAAAQQIVDSIVITP